MESYRSTNGRIRLPHSPTGQARPAIRDQVQDFLSPNYAPGGQHISSRPALKNGNRNGRIPNSGRNLPSDGLALPVPLTEGRRMRKSTEKRNLRLLIDTSDVRFPGLKRLKFRGKELNSLPSDVFLLKELELLDLSPEREACLYYKLPEVPSTISKLVNLKVLILDTNELVELPPEIGLLSQLQHLTLSNNCLSRLPDQITMLHNLNSIHLANNNFTTFPNQVLELESLSFLDLSDNSIEKIPNTIKKLRNLETLIMFANRLRELPEELCELMELRMLWIGNNCIRVLPKNFPKLKYLDWDWHYTSTTLDGNPLEHPPIEICRKGPKAIEKYLNDNWSKIQRGQPVYTPAPIYIRDRENRDTGREKRDTGREKRDTGREKRDTGREKRDTGREKRDRGRRDSDEELEYAQNFLGVDTRMMRNMRRGSTPIPSPVPDGLAALDD